MVSNLLGSTESTGERERGVRVLTRGNPTEADEGELN